MYVNNERCDAVEYNGSHLKESVCGICPQGELEMDQISEVSVQQAEAIAQVRGKSVSYLRDCPGEFATWKKEAAASEEL